MPDVKVYIRAENVDKWNSIASKADWINTLLKNADYTKTIYTPVGPAVVALTETHTLYAIIVEDTGQIIKDKLTLQGAEKWLDMNNPDGALKIVEMK